MKISIDLFASYSAFYFINIFILFCFAKEACNECIAHGKNKNKREMSKDESCTVHRDALSVRARMIHDIVCLRKSNAALFTCIFCFDYFISDSLLFFFLFAVFFSFCYSKLKSTIKKNETTKKQTERKKRKRRHRRVCVY